MQSSLYFVVRTFVQRQGANEQTVPVGKKNNIPPCLAKITPGLRFQASKRKCHNLSAFYSAHNRSVTFVQVEDPWAPDDDTIVDAQEYNTDRGTDTGVENADSGYHEMSDYGSVQSPSFQRAAALDAPQENTPPIYPSENLDLSPFNRVIASHLLRHFQQGPGQWYVWIELNPIFFANDLGWISSIQRLTSPQESSCLQHRGHY